MKRSLRGSHCELQVRCIQDDQRLTCLYSIAFLDRDLPGNCRDGKTQLCDMRRNDHCRGGDCLWRRDWVVCTRCRYRGQRGDQDECNETGTYEPQPIRSLHFHLHVYSPLLISTSAVIPHNRPWGCESGAIVTLKMTSPPTVLAIGEMPATFPLISLFNASTKTRVGSSFWMLCMSRSLKSVVSICNVFNVASVITT